MDLEAPQQVPALQCVNLLKRYNAIVALNGISFTVPYGRILGLLGPNGSGKTTLLKLAAGLLVAEGGEVRVGGYLPGIESKQTVSYLPDRDFLDGDMTFMSCCAMFRSFFADFDETRAMHLVAELGVDPKQRFKALSKGSREKVQLILVMSRQAGIYLLDEPIAGVDPATRDYILRTIIGNRRPGSTVIISTHLIQDVEQVLDDVLFIKDGSIALYNSAQALRNEHGKSVDELFREIYAYRPQVMPTQWAPVRPVMAGQPVMPEQPAVSEQPQVPEQPPVSEQPQVPEQPAASPEEEVRGDR